MTDPIHELHRLESLMAYAKMHAYNCYANGFPQQGVFQHLIYLETRDDFHDLQATMTEQQLSDYRKFDLRLGGIIV